MVVSLASEAHHFASKETPLPTLATLACSCLVSGRNPGGLPGRSSRNLCLEAAHSLVEDGQGVSGGKGQAGSQQPTQVSACTGCGGQKLLPLLPALWRKELDSVPELERRGKSEGCELLTAPHFPQLWE